MHTNMNTSIPPLYFLWTQMEEGREDYCSPHDDELKNRPFIHHRSTITQCTHHFHAVIRMVSSAWLDSWEGICALAGGSVINKWVNDM